MPTGEAFRSEWIDFEHGIRVGNIEPHERITQILKFFLEQRYRTSFVTDRWGRGVYWQWICWLSRANREAKPISNNVNFGCAKLFISADTDTKIFKSGLQVERGYAQGPEPYPGCLLKSDWDWHRLMKQSAAGSELDKELHRLLKHEGFTMEVGDWQANAVFTKKNFKSARPVRETARKYPKKKNGPASNSIIQCPSAKSAPVPAMNWSRRSRVFTEVTPAMNACMQVPLQETS